MVAISYKKKKKMIKNKLKTNLKIKKQMFTTLCQGKSITGII